MNLVQKFAIRYVFSKKKTNAINIISGITALAFAVGAAAMIIVLSALNGFETTLTGLFTAFDPALKVEAITGKTFELNPSKFEQLKKIKGIRDMALVIEDNAVVKYGESQEIAIIKGVSANYNQVTKIDSSIVEGKFLLEMSHDFLMGNSQINGGVFGYELTKKLGINVNHSGGFATIYVPKKGELNNLNPEQNLVIEKILPTGSFFVQEEIDSKYILVSLEFARRIFGYSNQVSALEISVLPNQNIKDIKLAIKKALGKKFSIKDQYEQKESIYKIFKSEKLATFTILSFILLIAAFNMAGALTMLIIEKEKDLIILRSMGVNNHTIQKIFMLSGLIISILGSIIGIGIGVLICWLQIKFGILRIENSVVDAYPMAINYRDLMLVFIVSLGIGLITSWIPVRRIKVKLQTN
jgi:lipoprotein-releasing system permease protein